MRIAGVSVRNIAGLPDCDLAFPDSGVVAFAGPNGSGKSKLLTCLIAPWIRDTPAAADADEPASVDVHLQLSELERDAINSYSNEVGWTSDARPPSEIVYKVVKRPNSGIAVFTEPRCLGLENGLGNVSMLSKVPSLDVLYLPAERRLNSGNSSVDLRQLLPEVLVGSLQHSRAASLNQAGRFDDSEFESFAVALCVSSYLPSEGAEGDGSEKSSWSTFKDAVNTVLAPKMLEDVTREHPDQLRVKLPTGETHPISQLSSGERQALTIISRVHRAGTDRTLVIIDEPDVHLHPNLSVALLRAITSNARSQVFLATHSPAILDGLDVGSVWEVRHGEPARRLDSEADRVELYRSAGFRASELTQAEILIVTEGDFDKDVLLALRPDLARASFRCVGGRSRVLEVVRSLSVYDIPVVGVVDSDVMASPIPAELANIVHCWPAADIEAVLLSDEIFIAGLVQRGLANPGETVESLTGELKSLAEDLKDNVIAEIAQRVARTELKDEYPSPKGNQPVERLRSYLTGRAPMVESQVDEIVRRATGLYEAQSFWWELTRGKYVVGKFASRKSPFSSTSSLLIAGVKAISPEIPQGVASFLKLIDERMGRIYAKQ